MSEATGMVTTVVDEPMDFTVIANSPKDMEGAQRSLILWAARKIQAIKSEISEAAEQLRIHTEKKWSTSAWRTMVGRLERRAEFYRKIKMALEAGYYIVPPFPLDVFAIRTNKESPQPYDSTSRNNHDQIPQVLSAGAGRYVDPRPGRESYQDSEKLRDGTTRQVTRYYATDFREVDFPFKLARAEIREATDKALSLKIFDQVGVMPRHRSPDPIVCGQILYPDTKLWRSYEHNKSVTFFIAWWLDTKTI